jgi:hypothetical protein
MVGSSSQLTAPPPVTRSWTDGNKNFVPDCDLLNPVAQNNLAGGGDFCGPLSNNNFGKPVFTNTYDPAILEGWGVRPSDWQIGVSVQQELLPRVAVEIGYYRRWLTHFSGANDTVNDNLFTSAASYDRFSITAPLDSRLPGGGGQAVSGLFDITPTLFGQINNLTTWGSNFGDEYSRYNGMLINLSARTRNGITFQGGVNTGKTVTDTCEVRANLPELTLTNPYCHVDSGFVTRLTGFGSYTIPKVDVLFSGTFRSDQGATLAANYSVTSAVAAQTLGRPLAGTTPNISVNLVAPGTLYGDRVNELDFRIAKVLRFGRTRTNVGFDIFNVLNANPVLTYNNSFTPITAANPNGQWLVPTSVLQSRFVKFSASIDF